MLAIWEIIVEIATHRADLAIVILSLPVGFYQPVGPDLLVILKGLTGGNALVSAGIAVVSTLAGAGLGFGVVRRWGSPLIRRLFRHNEEKLSKYNSLFHRYGSIFIVASAFGPPPLRFATWLAALSNINTGRFLLLVVIGLIPRFLGEAILAMYLKDYLMWLLTLFA